MLLKYLFVILIGNMFISPLFAGEPAADKKPVEKAEPKKKNVENSEPAKIEKNAEKKDQNQDAEGDLKINITSLKKIIEQDRVLLSRAESSYNKHNVYDDSPLENKRLARKFKQEIKQLKRRIAVHEEMVKRWESVLVKTTGKLEP